MAIQPGVPTFTIIRTAAASGEEDLDLRNVSSFRIRAWTVIGQNRSATEGAGRFVNVQFLPKGPVPATLITLGGGLSDRAIPVVSHFQNGVELDPGEGIRVRVSVATGDIVIGSIASWEFITRRDKDKYPLLGEAPAGVPAGGGDSQSGTGFAGIQTPPGVFPL